MSLDELTFRAVYSGRWDDLERLLESRGGSKACWCMVWRTTTAEAKQTDGKSRKAALHRMVRQGIPVGLIDYLGHEPVARGFIDTFQKAGFQEVGRAGTRRHVMRLRLR